MTNQERKEIGQKINYFRNNELKISVFGFADFIGITPRRLRDIERGVLSPEQELMGLAVKAAKTGDVRDLRAYLQARRDMR